MSATPNRSGGSLKDLFSPKRFGPAEVARRLEGFAVQPPAHLLPAQPVVGDRRGRTATWTLPALVGLVVLAITLWLMGCSAAQASTFSSEVCSQAAVGQSSSAPVPLDQSTVGGGPSLRGGVFGVVPAQAGPGGIAAAGGAADKPESIGTERKAARDRSGLVEVWPLASAPAQVATVRSGLSMFHGFVGAGAPWLRSAHAVVMTAGALPEPGARGPHRPALATSGG